MPRSSNSKPQKAPAGANAAAGTAGAAKPGRAMPKKPGVSKSDGAQGRAPRPATSGAAGKGGISATAKGEGQVTTPTKATPGSQDRALTSASTRSGVTVEQGPSPKAPSATKKASAGSGASVEKAPAKKAHTPKAAEPAPKAPAYTTPPKSAPAEVLPTKRARAADSEVPAARLTNSGSAVADPAVTERKAPVYVPLPVDVYDAKFLAEQSELLVAEQVAYTESAAELKAEADALAQDMEPGDVQFDEESGEGGTATIDRERDLVLSAQARAVVDEITHALVKIKARTYGSCENCRQPIPKARLKALPFARLCVACKSGGLSRR